ncbi:hypothetical protein M9H77_02027 [Catharanthus roseus]|uniref:Uncharacterized protein n=1 Tax=Catharanthus roseus TaxID=4058 RepID=A0ACC0C7D4_CATRO|nr:hypothetical protein M9H77_02027 [Catharanthus roseus]
MIYKLVSGRFKILNHLFGLALVSPYVAGRGSGFSKTTLPSSRNVVPKPQASTFKGGQRKLKHLRWLSKIILSLRWRRKVPQWIDRITKSSIEVLQQRGDLGMVMGSICQQWRIHIKKASTFYSVSNVIFSTSSTYKSS